MKQIQLEEDASPLSPEDKARFIRNLAREIRLSQEDGSGEAKLASSIESTAEALWLLLEP